MWAKECTTFSRPNATEATRCKTAATPRIRTRKTMLRTRPKCSETLPGALLAPRTSLRKIASHAPKTALNHAISRAIVTRTDAAIRLQSFGPPRPAHQRGAPLFTSARCARSLPPLAGLRAAWRALSSRRGLSTSVCRALPATPRAPFKRCQSRSVH